VESPATEKSTREWGSRHPLDHASVPRLALPSLGRAVPARGGEPSCALCHRSLIRVPSGEALDGSAGPHLNRGLACVGMFRQAGHPRLPAPTRLIQTTAPDLGSEVLTSRRMRRPAAPQFCSSIQRRCSADSARPARGRSTPRETDSMRRSTRRRAARRRRRIAPRSNRPRPRGSSDDSASWRLPRSRANPIRARRRRAPVGRGRGPAERAIPTRARRLRMTAGSCSVAISRSRPPQCGHARTSIAKERVSYCTSRSGCDDEVGRGGARVIRRRQRLG